MYKITIIWGIILLLLFSSILPVSSSYMVSSNNDIIYVDDVPGEGPDNPPEDYTRIQDAIDNASDGDTIFVYSGTYYEQISLYRSLILQGEDKNTTIIDGNKFWGDDVRDIIHITTNNTCIKGFTIQNNHGRGYSDDAGVDIRGNYNLITDNIISYSSNYGIYIKALNSNNTINQNIFDKNVIGMKLQFTSDTIISNNTFTNNYEGIRIEYVDHVTILNNTVINSTWPIKMINAYSCNISRNIITDDGFMILWSSCSNVISHNLIKNDKRRGIGIILTDSSNENIIEKNIITNHMQGISSGGACGTIIIGNIINNNSQYGIYFESGCNDNIISENTIANNSQCGIYFYWSSQGNNIYHNNFLNNMVHANNKGSNNWDDGWKGNYWDDYEERYPDASKTLRGVWNIPYELDDDNMDRFPLVQPYNIKPKTNDEHELESSWTTVDDRCNYYTRIYCKIENGSLSGYVNTSFFNPIEGALVSIKCGGLHMQNTSDSTGFYHIGDVPIVDCYWNVSVSKQGYDTFWVEMSIDINTTYDFILKPSGKILYVGGNGPDNYSKIQEALNNSSDGDTIFVYNGIYDEDLTIDKQLTLIGEDNNNTVIKGDFPKNILIIADEVNITNFFIKSEGYYHHGAIEIRSKYTTLYNNRITNSFDDSIEVEENSDYTTIENNYFFEVDDGINIYLIASNNHTIINNTFIDNPDNPDCIGIWVGGSDDNIVTDNTFINTSLAIRLSGKSSYNLIEKNIIKTSGSGIFLLYYSNHNKILNNIVETSGPFNIWSQDGSYNLINNNSLKYAEEGITLHRSSNNIITNNSIQYTKDFSFVLVENSDNNIVRCNNIKDNEMAGVVIHLASNNTIEENTIIDSGDYGFYVERFSNNNLIYRNHIARNKEKAIYFSNSSNNEIKSNNFILNSKKPSFENSENIWEDNYWNRFRFLPYIILGKNDGRFNFEFDMNPARQPFDIPSSEVSIE